jgi:PBP1b-binding outer membrane lipoprotein LpoB
MTRSTLVLAAALGALTLASCDDYDGDNRAGYQEAAPVEVAPAAEDSAEPVVAPEVEDPAPTAPPVDTLPPEKRTSEESVQPESETLFY